VKDTAKSFAAQPPLRLYKVTAPNGEPIHGGNGNWPLPTDGAPGAWLEVEGEIKKCQRGLHLTSEPARWWKPGCRVWEVEADGLVGELDSGRKIVCRRARLTRELVTASDLAAVHVYTEGEHRVSGETFALALGSSRVEAWESSSVVAWGSSSVVAWESSSVEAIQDDVTVISWVGRPGFRIVDRAVWIDRSGSKPEVYTAETPGQESTP